MTLYTSDVRWKRLILVFLLESQVCGEICSRGGKRKQAVRFSAPACHYRRSGLFPSGSAVCRCVLYGSERDFTKTGHHYRAIHPWRSMIVGSARATVLQDDLLLEATFAWHSLSSSRSVPWGACNATWAKLAPRGGRRNKVCSKPTPAPLSCFEQNKLADSPVHVCACVLTRQRLVRTWRSFRNNWFVFRSTANWAGLPAAIKYTSSRTMLSARGSPLKVMFTKCVMEQAVYLCQKLFVCSCTVMQWCRPTCWRMRAIALVASSWYNCFFPTCWTSHFCAMCRSTVWADFAGFLAIAEFKTSACALHSLCLDIGDETEKFLLFVFETQEPGPCRKRQSNKRYSDTTVQTFTASGHNSWFTSA